MGNGRLHHEAVRSLRRAAREGGEMRGRMRHNPYVDEDRVIHERGCYIRQQREAAARLRGTQKNSIADMQTRCTARREVPITLPKLKFMGDK